MNQIADTEHIYNHLANVELKENLLAKIAKINPQVNTSWLTKETTEVRLTPKPKESDQRLNKDEEILVKREIVTAEHLVQRKAWIRGWRRKGDRVDRKDDTTAPRALREMNRKAAVTTATKILKIQIETFIEMKRAFWIARFDKLKQTVNMRECQTNRKSREG